MFDIGASLAAARQSRGLGLADVERLTCLRARYLISLEEDRFDDLPGRAYARALFRTYAISSKLPPKIADAIIKTIRRGEPRAGRSRALVAPRRAAGLLLADFPSPRLGRELASEGSLAAA